MFEGGGTEVPNIKNARVGAFLVIGWKGGRAEKHANTKNASKRTRFCYWRGGGEGWGAGERLGGLGGLGGCRRRQPNTRTCPYWACSCLGVQQRPLNTKNVHVGTFYMFRGRGGRRGRQ